MRRPCAYCKRLLVYAPGQGWVHVDGGGTYWQRCGDCGWEGSGVAITSCPTCGGTRHLVDDHCGLPDMTEDPIPVPVVTEAQASDESLLPADPGPPEVIDSHPFHGGEVFIDRCVQCGMDLTHPAHQRVAV